MKRLIKTLFASWHLSRLDLKSNTGKWQVPILILLILLLPVLAGMQYYYLGKLSEAETLRLKNNLELSAKSFSEDFDSELTKIHQIFRFDEDSSIGFGSQLLQVYVAWKQDTSFPDLIKDIYLLEFLNDDPTLNIFNTQKGVFSPSDWPVELEKVKRDLPGYSGMSSPLLLSLTQAPLLDKYPLILSQCLHCRIVKNNINSSPVMEFNYLIIVLDSDVIHNRLIPALNKRHFPVQGDTKFDIAIAKQNEPNDVFYLSNPELDIEDFHNAEVRTEIGRWRDRNLMIVSAGIVSREDNTQKSQEEKENDLTSVKEEESGPFDESRLFKFKIDLTAAWELMVKYRHDTLDGIVSKARDRNLLISYFILVLLGVSMAMVYISSRRAHSLARRQLRFVSGVSHELRTPISVIRSAGENLADGLISDTEQKKRYGRLIRDEGRRLSAMIENILSFSAMQDGKAKFNLKATRIIGLLEECINNRSGSNDSANQNIIIESDSELPMVEADSESLKTAFKNIIENSLKYSPKGSPVLIRIRRLSAVEMLEIRFEDQGRGIGPEDLPHIFNPFFRGKNTEEERSPGSGLGLSLVKDIIERHGGKIEVKSQRHRGTTVSILLPVMPEETDAFKKKK